MAIRKNLKTFLLGSDIEFIITDKNGHVWCDGDKKSEIGYDGAENKITEIRSQPNECPLIITDNINQIFKRAIHRNEGYLKYKWRAGSYVANKALGAHIHVSSKGLIESKTLAEFLDQYVGSLSILTENYEQGLKRRASQNLHEDANGSLNCGCMTSFKNKNYGMEYRTISSFIHSPKVTKAFFTLSKIVVNEVINNPKFKGNKYVLPEDFTKMNQDKIRKSFPEIWAEISKMDLFKKYQSHIMILKNLIDKKKDWFTNKDMKVEWGLCKNIKPIQLKPEIDLINLWEDNAILKPHNIKLPKKHMLVKKDKQLGVVYDWNGYGEDKEY